MIFADTQFWDSIPHGDLLTVPIVADTKPAVVCWEALPKHHPYCYPVS